MTQTNGFTPQRIAFIVENGFEDSEFQVPFKALRQTSADIVVLGSRMNDTYSGKRGRVTTEPEATFTEVRAEDFDAFIIPGGHAPDKLRTRPHAVRLVSQAMVQNKLVAAVCHGPQLLIEADQLRGRRATGYQAVCRDMENAGATVVNEPVVVDGNLITARRPADMPIFTTAILSQLGLTLEGQTLPDPTELNQEWWQLGEQWGGSSQQDIVNTLNTALVGELYTLAAFRQYAEKVDGAELSQALQAVVTSKESHAALLEQRLQVFGEQVTWQAVSSEAFAALQSWIQASDELSILRRSLGDLQTGTVDAGQFCSQLTDPVTTQLLTQIHETLMAHEQRFGELYRNRVGQAVEPPVPTTVAIS